MPYNIFWTDETKTIVQQIYDGPLSRCDFESMICASQDMLETVSHPVDVIIEWSGERTVVHDMTLVYAALFAEKRVPSNQRYVFLVNVPPIVKTLIHLLRQAAPRATASTYFLDSVAGAYCLRAILLETETLPMPEHNRDIVADQGGLAV